MHNYNHISYMTLKTFVVFLHVCLPFCHHFFFHVCLPFCFKKNYNFLRKKVLKKMCTNLSRFFLFACICLFSRWLVVATRKSLCSVFLQKFLLFLNMLCHGCEISTHSKGILPISIILTLYIILPFKTKKKARIS